MYYFISSLEWLLHPCKSLGHGAMERTLALESGNLIFTPTHASNLPRDLDPIALLGEPQRLHL